MEQDALDTRNLFKNKRDQYVVEIRKQKKKNTLMEKRVKRIKGGNAESNAQLLGQLFTNKNLTAGEQLMDLKEKFYRARDARDSEAFQKIVKGIRLVMSLEDIPPCHEFHATKLLPDIIALLDYKNWENSQLVQDAMWIVCNFASSQESKFTGQVIDMRVEQIAMNLLDHPDANVKDIAVYFLANVAGDCIEYRDLLVKECKILEKLDGMLKDTSGWEMELIDDVCWLISNLTKKPYQPFEDVCCLLPFLQFAINLENKDVQKHVLWTLSYLSDGEDAQITEVINMDVIPRVLEILKNTSDTDVGSPALRLLGNIVTGYDDDTDIVLNLGLIDILAPILDSQIKFFRKEAAWAFSNILSGPSEHIELVFKYGDGMIFKRLFKMAYDDHIDVRCEAIHALCNTCDQAVFSQIQRMVDNGILDLIIQVFDEYNNPSVLKSCLDALNSIFAYGNVGIMGGGDKADNVFVQKFSHLGGNALVETLQNHPDDSVYKKVEKLIDHYFPHEH